MGANTDTGIWVGRYVNEAFNAIAKDRAHWYGHGGYTGTFAETPRAALIGTLPARVTSDMFATLIKELKSDFNPKQKRYGNKFEAYSTLQGKYVTSTKPFTIDTVFEDREVERLTYDGKPYTRTQKVPVSEKRRYSPCWPASFKKDKSLQEMAYTFAEIGDQKWEDAAAVKLNNQERLSVISYSFPEYKGKHGINAYYFMARCSS